MKEDVSLAGRLRFLTLGELLQVLGTNGSTGVLSISSRFAPEPGLVYFHQGAPIHAKALKMTGIDALYSLFGWTDGEFEFKELKNAEVKRSINQGLMEIVMDGCRLLDDGQIKVLGPDTAEELTGEKPPPAPAPKRPKLSGIPIIRMHVKNQSQIVAQTEFSRNQPLQSPEGDSKPWLCVILKGFANVFKDTQNGACRICRLGPGAMAGVVPSVNGSGSAKAIRVTAAGQVMAGVFDSARLNAEFSRLSYQLRRLLLGLDRRWVQVSERVAEAQQHAVKPGDFIQRVSTRILQGEPYGEAHLITDGWATVIRRIGDGFVPLARLGQGDFLGNVPFMSIGHEPNAAQVMASPNLKTRRIDLDRMQAEYDLASPLVRAFVENIANCVSITTMVACDLISPVPFSNGS